MILKQYVKVSCLLQIYVEMSELNVKKLEVQIQILKQLYCMQAMFF